MKLVWAPGPLGWPKEKGVWGKRRRRESTEENSLLLLLLLLLLLPSLVRNRTAWALSKAWMEFWTESL